MGKCLKCGVKYCNCPSDGYCDKCLGVMFGETAKTNMPVRQPNASTGNCKFTRKILEHYQTVLSCLSKKPAAMSKLQLNQNDLATYLSYNQSALNIDNDYCRYSRMLDKITPIVQNALAQGLCQ